MNNYNTVFNIIKEYCKKPEEENKECLIHLQETIAKSDTKLSVNTYLDALQGLGLITWSKRKKTVSITAKGIETTHLFKIYADRQQ